MKPKPYAANRRVIAVEVKNMLQLRRSMRLLRREIAAGQLAAEMVRTPRGYIARGALLRYAEVSFGLSVARTCAARRVLFRMIAGEATVTRKGNSAEWSQ